MLDWHLTAAPAFRFRRAARVLRAKQHVGNLIGGLLASRAAIRPRPPAASRPLMTCTSWPVPSSVPCSAWGPRRRRSARSSASFPPWSARAVSRSGRAAGPAGDRFGVAVACVMLRDREDPDSRIARPPGTPGKGPGSLLADWRGTNPAIQAALIRHVPPGTDVLPRLRYGKAEGTARLRDPGPRREQRRAALPRMVWHGWALRRMPPSGLLYPPFRARVLGSL